MDIASSIARGGLLGLIQMSRMVSCAAIFLGLCCGAARVAAETLEDALRAAMVPTEPFAAAERGGKITSYAVSKDNPFLLAYYTDDGSGQLKEPLHVVRYYRPTGDLQRADLRDIHALSDVRIDCLGSALSIRGHGERIYIQTHLNPSAGCVIVLSSTLAFQTAFSGGLEGFLGESAIFRRGEIHFMSVHPLHLAVFDLPRNQATDVYPYADDPQRREFSRLIEPHISKQWCMEANAQCDPENFDTDVRGHVIVNESARVFGFEARFDAAGFGPEAEAQVPQRTVAYLFREQAGGWEHQEFGEPELQRLLGGMSLEELISEKPDLAFQTAGGK